MPDEFDSTRIKGATKDKLSSALEDLETLAQSAQEEIDSINDAENAEDRDDARETALDAIREVQQAGAELDRLLSEKLAEAV